MPRSARAPAIVRAALADEAYPVGGAASSERYGADFWASPLQTLGSGAGDCEDYAIVKYVALRDMGFDPSNLRFVIVRDMARQTDHAVVTVRDGQDWLILDNRTMLILNAEDARQYQPL